MNDLHTWLKAELVSPKPVVNIFATCNGMPTRKDGQARLKALLAAKQELGIQAVEINGQFHWTLQPRRATDEKPLEELYEDFRELKESPVRRLKLVPKPEDEIAA